jgi:hypothetical protein
MVIKSQSEGNWQDDIGLGTVGVSGKTVGDEVRVGSPGFGVWKMTVGEFAVVAVFVDVEACEISGVFSENAMTRLPPIIIIETRAARSPVINSRRTFMKNYPLMMEYRLMVNSHWKEESTS